MCYKDPSSLTIFSVVTPCKLARIYQRFGINMETVTFLRNVCTRLEDHVALWSRRPTQTSWPSWGPQISYVSYSFVPVQYIIILNCWMPFSANFARNLAGRCAAENTPGAMKAPPYVFKCLKPKTRNVTQTECYNKNLLLPYSEVFVQFKDRTK
jgi:hypothetical protein